MWRRYLLHLYHPPSSLCCVPHTRNSYMYFTPTSLNSIKCIIINLGLHHQSTKLFLYTGIYLLNRAFFVCISVSFYSIKQWKAVSYHMNQIFTGHSPSKKPLEITAYQLSVCFKIQIYKISIQCKHIANICQNNILHKDQF